MKNEPHFFSNEICDENAAGNITMCPQCAEHCPYWNLEKSCGLSRFTYLVDNGGTVFFSIFMSFWATAFIEFWKRRQAVIAWEWDLTDFEDVEQTRPEFEAHVRTTRINPVTRKPEPYLSPWSKMARVSFTYSFVLLMVISSGKRSAARFFLLAFDKSWFYAQSQLFQLCVVMVAVFAVMIYRLAITLVMYQWAKDRSEFFYSNSKMIISMSAAFLNLIAILILNKARSSSS